MDVLQFSKACFLCETPAKTSHGLCADCYRQVPRIQQHCLMCGIPLQADKLYCGQCLRQAKPFQRSFIPTVYQFPTDRFIQQLKFQHHFNHLPVLTQLLIDHLAHKQLNTLPDALIPVPLHPKRMRQRGFNQSTELCKHLAKHFHIPVLNQTVKRIVNTPAQTGLSAKLRSKNMRQAFQITHPMTARHVAIVDDVVTTTSTVSALAQVLTSAGVQRVDVWAIARACSG